jgi:AcrR family transcriptional regulator
MPKRSAADAALTRAAVVASARASFARRGYAGTSLEEIARDAAVTRGAVHHHFTDKRTLFVEVFEEIERELNDAVVAAAHTAPKAERMRAGVRALLDFCRRDDYRQIALSDAPGVLGLVTWYEADRTAGMGTLRVGVQALADAGALPHHLVEPMTVLLFGALTEAALVVGGGLTDLDPDELLDAFEFLVGGLSALQSAGQ